MSFSEYLPFVIGMMACTPFFYIFYAFGKFTGLNIASKAIDKCIAEIRDVVDSKQKEKSVKQ